MSNPRLIRLMTGEPTRRKVEKAKPLTEMQWQTCYLSICYNYLLMCERLRGDKYRAFARFVIL